MKYPSIRTHPNIQYGEELFTFKVDRKHLKGSVVGDPENCAGSCALKEMDGVVNAWVRRTRTVIEFSDGRVVIWLNPARLSKAVDGFDNSAGLFPEGEYELRPLGASRRRDSLTRQNQDKNRTATRNTKPRRRPVFAVR